MWLAPERSDSTLSRKCLQDFWIIFEFMAHPPPWGFRMMLALSSWRQRCCYAPKVSWGYVHKPLNSWVRKRTGETDQVKYDPSTCVHLREHSREHLCEHSSGSLCNGINSEKSNFRGRFRGHSREHLHEHFSWEHSWVKFGFRQMSEPMASFSWKSLLKSCPLSFPIGC